MSDALGNSLDVDLGTAYYVGVQETYGCTDPLADNYNPDATADDGNCEYEGCTDPLADNYDPDANLNDDDFIVTANKDATSFSLGGTKTLNGKVVTMN